MQHASIETAGGVRNARRLGWQRFRERRQASGCAMQAIGKGLARRRWLSALLSLGAIGGATVADAGEAPIVQLSTTAGEIRIRLLPDKAPRTVENFLQLADDGFYNGLIFHRVIANFVIQAGGYDVEMNYRKPPRTVANESFNGLRNRRGTVAMARLKDPDSADAQFFINVNDNTHLDAKAGQPGYTVFGEVTAGMEAVTAIELSDTQVRNGMAGVPEAPIVILGLRRVSEAD